MELSTKDLEKDATKVNDGAKADPDKQQYEQRRAEERTERIARATHAFNKFHIAYARDHNLEPEEVVAAAYLENLNCREFFPPRLGGTKKYDEICSEVLAWFEENKGK